MYENDYRLEPFREYIEDYEKALDILVDAPYIDLESVDFFDKIYNEITLEIIRAKKILNDKELEIKNENHIPRID